MTGDIFVMITQMKNVFSTPSHVQPILFVNVLSYVNGFYSQFLTFFHGQITLVEKKCCVARNSIANKSIMEVQWWCKVVWPRRKF